MLGEQPERTVLMRCTRVQVARHAEGATAYKCEGELMLVEPGGFPRAAGKTTALTFLLRIPPGGADGGWETRAVAAAADLSGTGCAERPRQAANEPVPCVLLRMEVRSPRPTARLMIYGRSGISVGPLMRATI